MFSQKVDAPAVPEDAPLGDLCRLWRDLEQFQKGFGAKETGSNTSGSCQCVCRMYLSGNTCIAMRVCVDCFVVNPVNLVQTTGTQELTFF